MANERARIEGQQAAGFFHDNASGLDMQFDGSPTTMSQAASVAYCASLPLAGGGWRLPTKDELLVVYANRAHLQPIVNWITFWSSSPARVGQQNFGQTIGWIVDWSNGNALDLNGTSLTRARCVR